MKILKSKWIIGGLIVALGVVIALFILNRQKPVPVIYPVVGGISSAALNLLILLLITSPLSESVIFPGIAVGGWVLTTIFSVIAYKEKMRHISMCLKY